jgi:hypothetical protein
VFFQTNYSQTKNHVIASLLQVLDSRMLRVQASAVAKEFRKAEAAE